MVICTIQRSRGHSDTRHAVGSVQGSNIIGTTRLAQSGNCVVWYIELDGVVLSIGPEVCQAKAIYECLIKYSARFLVLRAALRHIMVGETF